MIFAGQSIRVELREEGIIELCYDARGASVNKLDVRTVEELGAATQAIRETDAARGVLVTSAKDAFIVGADIIPDGVFAEAESLAKQLRATRSEIYSRALGEFLGRHAPDRFTEG